MAIFFGPGRSALDDAVRVDEELSGTGDERRRVCLAEFDEATVERFEDGVPAEGDLRGLRFPSTPQPSHYAFLATITFVKLRPDRLRAGFRGPAESVTILVRQVDSTAAYSL